MTPCAFCGRENDAESRFCIDCGKPINSSAARVGPAYVPQPGGQPQPYTAPAAVRAESAASGGGLPAPVANGAGVPATRVSSGAGSCPRCGKSVGPGLPFCAHCGTRVTANTEPANCPQCSAPYTKGVDMFCSRCGQRLGQRVSVETTLMGGTQVLGAVRRSLGPKLSLLGDSGEVKQTYTLDGGEAVVGRGEADIQFIDDHYLSPLHARLGMRDGQLWLRDLGSRNGSWIFIDEPTKLADGDLMLVGSQIIRFRRLGYPGPHPPEADSTRRMGSVLPNVDVAVVEQLRADASVRDTFHLSPGRTVFLGREVGDWLFPYDVTMSGKHAEVRSEASEFYIHDAASRNGVAMSVRGERPLKKGQRILLGDQILRVETL